MTRQRGTSINCSSEGFFFFLSVRGRRRDRGRKTERERGRTDRDDMKEDRDGKKNDGRF